MAHQRMFHFGSTNAVTRDIDHIIDAALEPLVPVGFLHAPVTCKVQVVVHGKVGIDKAVMVAPHGARNRGPTLGDAQFA
jgi:hypothetical protein